MYSMNFHAASSLASLPVSVSHRDPPPMITPPSSFCSILGRYPVPTSNGEESTAFFRIAVDSMIIPTCPEKNAVWVSAVVVP